jgi:uncharacterized membrane-anchored protein
VAKAATIENYPGRVDLANEFHARPFAYLQAPEQASYFAMLTAGTENADHTQFLIALCDRYGAAHPPAGASHHRTDLGPCRLKWERHSEFVSYTFFRHSPFEHPFAEPASAHVDADLLDVMPGQRIVATHVALEPEADSGDDLDRLGDFFVAESLCMSVAAGAAARVMTDYQIHADGFGRILIRDTGLGRRQAGRLVQRLLEIDTYRLLAMMALPVARAADPTVTAIEQDLAAVTRELGAVEDPEGQRALLDRITAMAARNEEVAAGAAYRFSAARAYHRLIDDRVRELREDRVEGFQTIGEFMDRRLAPAMRTCASVAERQEALARRVARAANLLRTRVDLEVEAQNRDLLASMNRRARLQLRLQETVEGLSVVAITYYLVGLIGYGLDAIEKTGAAIDKTLIQAASIPVIAALIWIGIRRLRRRLRLDEPTGSADE